MNGCVFSERKAIRTIRCSKRIGSEENILVERVIKFIIKNFNQIIKFCMIGGTGIVINMLILFTLTEVFGIWYMVSNIFAIGTAATWNYIGYRFWVFKN